MKEKIFNITSGKEFRVLASDIFRYQAQENDVYREFAFHMKINPLKVTAVEDIPFLPVEFFKRRRVITGKDDVGHCFVSSSTTGSTPSKHYVADIGLYEKSFLSCFRKFYGPPDDYCILALLPGYLERKDSSLVYMVNSMIEKGGHSDSGFYLGDHNSLRNKLLKLEKAGQKTILIGVAFALMDFALKHKLELKHTVVMETGGMKGRRKEIVKEELHQILQERLGVEAIHSEYGMTELLSQAYSKGNNCFHCPPWMKVMIRDIYDPMSYVATGRIGGINVVDLANLYSCSFVETQDLGRINSDGSFEVLGRFDHSDVRGCNLMAV
ncbi:MAG: acyl transferase [Bacteroidetes bacterium]|nr:acyl transferase [Bacteroidota bacterium]